MTEIQDPKFDQSDKNIPMHMPVDFSETHHRHIGPILGILLILLVLILGGLYLWGAMMSKTEEVYIETPIINDEPETPRAVADQQILEITSPSDDLTALEADISSTNFDSLDTDMGAIDGELNAVLVQ